MDLTPSGRDDDSRIRVFFQAFAVASETLAADVLGDMFAAQFLSADAAGARPVTRTAFLQVLPRRAQMFADAGVGRATLTAVSHTRLDPHYLLVRTEWTAPRATSAEPVRLASSFLIHDDGDRLEIVLYLNHKGLPR